MKMNLIVRLYEIVTAISHWSENLRVALLLRAFGVTNDCRPPIPWRKRCGLPDFGEPWPLSTANEHYRGGVPRLVKGAVKQPSVWIDTDKGKQHRGSTGTTLGADIPTPEVDAAWGDDAWLQEDETDNGGAW